MKRRERKAYKRTIKYNSGIKGGGVGWKVRIYFLSVWEEEEERTIEQQ